MLRVLIIREGIAHDGTPISDVRVRGNDGSNTFERVDLANTPEAFEAARYALLDNASDEQIAQMTSLIDQWQVDAALRPGQLVLHEGIVYRVQQAHTSQADWLPQDTPALYRALGNEEEVMDDYPLWIQPIGGHDAYSRGDRVTYNDIRWESSLDNNVWSPSVFGWTAL